jgi:hypothetical protein
VELDGAQFSPARAGLLDDALGGQLHPEIVERRPVDSVDLQDASAPTMEMSTVCRAAVAELTQCNYWGASPLKAGRRAGG